MRESDLYSAIKFIPLGKCLAHEGVVQKWVEGIAFNIQDIGVMKNPIIVTKHDPYYIVIDGMHRFAACKHLEVRDILVYEVDYSSPEIVLEGWDAFTFSPLHCEKLLRSLFLESDGFLIKKISGLRKAQKAVITRNALLAAADRDSTVHIVQKKDGSLPTVEDLSRATELIDRAIDTEGLKVAYVANSLSLHDFSHVDAKSIVMRPVFTKKEIIENTIQQKLFPRKSTKHVIPNRPLRVDINLALLRTDIDLETKNQVLKEHLRWCYESDRVRYYPESIFIFSD